MSLLALDIGGAHIKVVHSQGQAVVYPFALWRRPQELAQALAEATKGLPPFNKLAITMTGELCDGFATKYQGVLHIFEHIERWVRSCPVDVWQTTGRFVSLEQAKQDPLPCAAANWHALATFVASLFCQGTSLLIDVGSTTTDIILLDQGTVRARGLTDTDRLVSGELVYIGAQRTPLMALGPTIGWRGCQVPLMAELFATTADVYLLTGQVEPQPQCMDTADGRPMTKDAAAARIVRMVGADLEGGLARFCSEDAAKRSQSPIELARAFDQVILARLSGAIIRVAGEARPDRVVTCGSGAFIAEAAARSSLDGVSMVSLADHIGDKAAAAACAYALQHLP